MESPSPSLARAIVKKGQGEQAPNKPALASLLVLGCR
jgi:hypothetical protein